MTSAPGTKVVRTIAVAALLIYGWWFTSLQPFTGGSLIALCGAAALLLALATTHCRSGTGHAHRDEVAAAPGFVAATVMWLSVALAATAWELIAFFGQPRSQHPTISSLLDSTQTHHALRLAVFVLWLMLGWVIAS